MSLAHEKGYTVETLGQMQAYCCNRCGTLVPWAKLDVHRDWHDRRA